MKAFLRQLTDVEIDARIATRFAALTTRLERLEHVVDALLLMHEILNEQALDAARQTLTPSPGERPWIVSGPPSPSAGSS